MAALLHPSPGPEIVDLRRVSAPALEPLLQEETQTWRETLGWDFTRSANLVRRFLELRALQGLGLMEAGEAVGYGYCVIEEHKALIGDLFVRAAYRGAEPEILEALLQRLLRTERLERIEAQLMLLDAGLELPVLPGWPLQVYERSFMLLDFGSAPELDPRKPRPHVHIDRWSEGRQDAAAQLILSAYAGHIDASINDQYRTAAGARRFLYNIVQYPGCGAFLGSGSVAAFDTVRGRMCGMSLASLVAENAGHITQICVAPAERGTGLGQELLRQSLAVLRAAGCLTASLTVTSANMEAIRLYEKAGFRTVRRFRACVWEPGRAV
jgi:ribosomal protein S18 acetylase RimI-like enzyme